MKVHIDRDIVSQLIEQNISAYNLLHQQYADLDMRYNQCIHAYNGLRQNVEGQGLVPAEQVEELKEAYKRIVEAADQQSIELDNAKAEAAQWKKVAHVNEEQANRYHDQVLELEEAKDAKYYR